MLSNNEYIVKIWKVILFYSIFIFINIINKIPIEYNFIFNFLPNFANLIIFYFAILKEDKIGDNVIFILGLVFDIINSLPIGLTSLSWLLSVKILLNLRDYFLIDESVQYFSRDIFIFIFLQYFFQYILFSYFQNLFYPFGLTILSFFYNIIFYIVLYIIYIKIKNRAEF